MFVPTNENNFTSLVKFPLFMTFLTNQDVLVYPFKNITQDALDFKTANCMNLKQCETRCMDRVPPFMHRLSFMRMRTQFYSPLSVIRIRTHFYSALLEFYKICRWNDYFSNDLQWPKYVACELRTLRAIQSKRNLMLCVISCSNHFVQGTYNVNCFTLSYRGLL